MAKMLHPYYDKISFPSGRLTVQRMIEVDIPYLNEAVRQEKCLDDVIHFDSFFATLELERKVAARAFRTALGIAMPRDESKREWGREAQLLTDAYQEYGLADGPFTAKQLVREIESQARDQAKELFAQGL